MNIKKVVYLGFFLVGCQNHKTSEMPVDVLKNCDNVEFRAHYTEYTSWGSNVSYNHYIYVKGYDSRCIGLIPFAKISKQYRDTVKVDLPVRSVYFISSLDDFSSKAESPEFKNLIIGFGFNLIDFKKPDIEKVYFYQGEQVRWVDVN